MPSIHIAKFLGSPVNPIASDKNDEPAKIKAIMQDVLVAPSKDFLKVSKVKLFWKYESIKEPTTPRDAASVAVAIPVYIDPMTAKIKIITGNSFLDLFNFSIKVKFSNDFGIIFLFIEDQIITYSMNIIAIIIPGKIPAINSFAMDSWTVTP